MPHVLPKNSGSCRGSRRRGSPEATGMLHDTRQGVLARPSPDEVIEQRFAGCRYRPKLHRAGPRCTHSITQQRKSGHALRTHYPSGPGRQAEEERAAVGWASPPPATRGAGSDDVRGRAEVSGKVEDVAHGGGAEGVDRLRVVADHGLPWPLGLSASTTEACSWLVSWYSSTRTWWNRLETAAIDGSAIVYAQ
jgi:hypothetical protein